MKEFYENLYKNNESVFGEEPSRIVSEIPLLIPNGSVLDIGAGEGRNSLFLAQKGFDVSAIDFSNTALQKLKDNAEKFGLSVRVQDVDMEQFNFERKFDVFVSIRVLHYLRKSFAENFISNMQSHTNVAGLNVIHAFTKNGDFYKQDPETSLYYVSEGELEEKYKDWEIIKNKKTTGRALQRGKNGELLYNESIEFIARKLADPHTYEDGMTRSTKTETLS